MDTYSLWIISEHASTCQCSFWMSHSLASSHFICQEEQGPQSSQRSPSDCLLASAKVRTVVGPLQMGEGDSNPTLSSSFPVLNSSPVISTSAPTRRVLEALKSEGVMDFWQPLGEVVVF